MARMQNPNLVILNLAVEQLGELADEMAEDDSEREKPAFILIDPPVGPYSGKDAIESWIQELQEMPDSPEVKAAIEQAAEWLECPENEP